LLKDLRLGSSSEYLPYEDTECVQQAKRIDNKQVHNKAKILAEVLWPHSINTKLTFILHIKVN